MSLFDLNCRQINSLGVMALGRILDQEHLCAMLKWASIDLPCPETPLPREARLLLDLKVLCEIACCCLKEPNISSSGARLYQNCVADTLREAKGRTGGRTPYHPEAGYRMTDPPVLRPVPRNNRPPDYPGDGTVRVDVVAVIDAGKPPTPDNILQIYEMKFPGDPANPYQIEKYEGIAPTLLVDVNDCDCDDDEGERVPVLVAADAYERQREQATRRQMNEKGNQVLGELVWRLLLRRPRPVPRPAPRPTPIPVPAQ